MKQICRHDQQATILPPLFNKGLALLNLNQSEEAITFFDKVLAQEQGAEDGLYDKAVALYSLRRDEEGITFFI